MLEEVALSCGRVVDLTWATPAAARLVQDWKVVDEAETLSDHLYIQMEVFAAPPELPARRQAREARSRRWALGKLDSDRFGAILQAITWPEVDQTG